MLSSFISLLGIPLVWGILLGLAAASIASTWLLKKLAPLTNLKDIFVDIVSVLVFAFFVFVFMGTHDIVSGIFAVILGSAWKMIYNWLVKLINHYFPNNSFISGLAAQL